jgi:hypothetical protein
LFDAQREIHVMPVADDRHLKFVFSPCSGITEYKGKSFGMYFPPGGGDTEKGADFGQ